jgi:tRNA(Ile)-lysidine synthase
MSSVAGTGRRRLTGDPHAAAHSPTAARPASTRLMTLAASVLRTIRRDALIAPGGRVVVALSGGPDSVALVHLLRELEAGGHLTLAGLAHFNHQLRGADADADEAFCRGIAAEWSLRIECETADVRAAAARDGRSIEDAARTLRYAFLERAADRLGAAAIATGHSRDDQAETFLLRLLRGSGPRGLAGILPRAGRVVRPLLDVSRADLRAYVAARSLAFRDDASNADVRIPRNRIRHELLPYLEREFSPGIAAVLAREAVIARQDEAHLQAAAIDLASSIVLSSGEGTEESEVDAVALTSTPPALAARVARMALQTRAPGGFVGFDQVERFLHFAASARTGAALSLPGQRAVHDGRRVVLAPEPPRRRNRDLTANRVFANSFSFPLSIPGEVRLDKQGWVIAAEQVDASAAAGDQASGALSVEVAAAAVRLPLVIRSRRAGDRFRPSGLGHRKKLHDFLIDRKIPRETRDLLPLVVDGEDRIVWVVGHSVAEDFRVTGASRGVILLKSRRLGGLG